MGIGVGTRGARGTIAPPLFVHLLIANHRVYLGNEYVKTPNLARNRDSKTAAGESDIL